MGWGTAFVFLWFCFLETEETESFTAPPSLSDTMAAMPISSQLNIQYTATGRDAQNKPSSVTPQKPSSSLNQVEHEGAWCQNNGDATKDFHGGYEQLSENSYSW